MELSRTRGALFRSEARKNRLGHRLALSLGKTDESRITVLSIRAKGRDLVRANVIH